MRLFNLIPAIVFSALFFYLCGSFYSATLKISEWTETTRFLMVLMFMSLVLGFGLINFFENRKD